MREKQATCSFWASGGSQPRVSSGPSEDAWPERSWWRGAEGGHRRPLCTTRPAGERPPATVPQLFPGVSKTPSEMQSLGPSGGDSSAQVSPGICPPAWVGGGSPGGRGPGHPLPELSEERPAQPAGPVASDPLGRASYWGPTSPQTWTAWPGRPPQPTVPPTGAEVPSLLRQDFTATKFLLSSQAPSPSWRMPRCPPPPCGPEYRARGVWGRSGGSALGQRLCLWGNRPHPQSPVCPPTETLQTSLKSCF